MIDLDKGFGELFKKEGLLKYHTFFLPYETAETIPLYSRYSHIDFLSGYSFNQKNKIIIKHGLGLIRSIIQKAPEYLSGSEIDELFICLSVSNWNEDDYQEIDSLMYHVFITRRKEWLLSHAQYTKKNTIEESLIKEYLSSLNIHDCSVFVSKNFTAHDEYRQVNIVTNNFFADINRCKVI